MADFKVVQKRFWIVCHSLCRFVKIVRFSLQRNKNKAKQTVTTIICSCPFCDETCMCVCLCTCVFVSKTRTLLPFWIVPLLLGCCSLSGKNKSKPHPSFSNLHHEWIHWICAIRSPPEHSHYKLIDSNILMSTLLVYTGYNYSSVSFLFDSRASVCVFSNSKITSVLWFNDQ